VAKDENKLQHDRSISMGEDEKMSQVAIMTKLEAKTPRKQNDSSTAVVPLAKKLAARRIEW
jgi:hypothetical protein